MIGFKKYLKLPLTEQKKLREHDFSEWDGFNEDVSGQVKKDLRSLEVLLKKHDWWYSMSDDGASYRKGRKEDDEIHDLMRKIGTDDAKRMWIKYAKKAGVMETKNIDDEYTGMCKKRKIVEQSNIQKTADYMNPRTWFPDMQKVKATGSLNMNEANDSIPINDRGYSYHNHNVGWNYDR